MMEKSKSDLKAIVADDISEIRQEIKDLLEDLGFLVKEAKNGDQVLDILREGNYSLIIMDLIMENGTINGIETTKKAKQMFPNIRVVAITDHEKELLEKAIRAGACYALEKETAFDDNFHYFKKIIDNISSCIKLTIN